MPATINVASQHQNARHGWRHLWASARWSMKFSRLCQESFERNCRLDAEALQRIFQRCDA